MKLKKTTHYELMTVGEAGRYTGLSIKTLYTMVSQRRIPYVKAGRSLRFDKGHLNDWLKEQTVMPMPEGKG